MPSLYRDYRPQTFAELIGQEHIKQTLQNAIAKGTFAHAYLLTGPRGTGKTTTARIVARAINCLHQEKGEPDNSCAICKSFIAGTALDLTEIDAASNTGIENIREIIERLAFSPAEAKYKVFIVDEVHMLSKGAFNALLKTLEEPPTHAIFILATTEIAKVPATIISRTQRFDFTKISHADLLKHLQKVATEAGITADDEALELVVQAADGGVRDALSILDKLSAFGAVNRESAELLLGIANASDVRKLLDFIIAKDPAGALNHVRALLQNGLDPAQFNKDFLEYLRALLTHSLGATPVGVVGKGMQADLERHAAALPSQKMLHVIRLFLRAHKDFESAPSLDLPLEAAIAESSMPEIPVTAVRPQAQASSIPAVKHIVHQVAKQSPVEPVREISIEVPTETALHRTVAGKLISESALTAEWNMILQEIKTANSPMLALMKSMKVKSCEDNHIVFVCEYSFHKNSMNVSKNKETLRGVLKAHFGEEMTFEILVEKVEQERMDTAGAALEILGGEMI
jgi:DNA polymerase-3 subunit gamma/tau